MCSSDLTPFDQLLPYLVVACICMPISGVLIYRKKATVFTMYFQACYFTLICFLLMVYNPGWINYILIFFAIFLTALYQHVGVCVIQCILGAVCLTYYSFEYMEALSSSYTLYDTILIVNMIPLILTINVVMSLLTKRLYNDLVQALTTSEKARNKAETLAYAIGRNVENLNEANQNILDDIKETNQIAHELVESSSEVQTKTIEQIKMLTMLKQLIEETSKEEAVAQIEVLVGNVGEIAKEIEELNIQIEVLHENMDDISEHYEALTQIATHLDGLS